MCFYVRSFRLSRADALLGMRFTDEQWSLMSDVILEAGDDSVDERSQAVFARTRDSGYQIEGDESDGGSGDDFKPADTATRATGSLDHAVFRFMVASIKVHVGDDMYSNALLCFCADTSPAARVRQPDRVHWAACHRVLDEPRLLS